MTSAIAWIALLASIVILGIAYQHTTGAGMPNTFDTIASEVK
jgi:hypothetical protein